MELVKKIESCQYLSDIRARYQDLEEYADGRREVDRKRLETCIEALGGIDPASYAQTSLCSEQLREHKARFSFLWSVAELSGNVAFADLGRLQSHFAERTIQIALEIAWRNEKIARYFVNPDGLAAADSGLFVLGLGKLGGLDLNFSSDVDLVAIYDPEQLKVGPMYGASYAVTECLKLFGKVLSEQTPDGFVWRLDWRLRPYASLRNLAMTADKALDFYHYSARPWHRLAMIKARPVAGNFALGGKFLENLRSFLWRHDLDYRAIDDIAILKERINLEHPALAQQREQGAVDFAQGRGMNLKLGHGGIREIEFVVNAQQLLWGGRKPALRVTNTLQALDVLEAEELIDDADAGQLREAYRFLRHAENRLQMQHNDQVYHLPKEQAALDNYLLRWDGLDWQAFNKRLTAHRRQVYRIFTAAFAQERPENAPESGSETWPLERLSEQGQGIVHCWLDGFTAYGLPTGHALQFQPLQAALAGEIRNSGCELEEAVVTIDDYFRRLPPGGQYFRLLRDFPWLLEKLIKPLLLSPAMASLLRQSPHIIDRFLEQRPDFDAPLDTTIVFSSRDYEYRLGNLRRLANEELYLRYSEYFEGRTLPDDFRRQLTSLAEQLLDATVRVASEELQLSEAPVAVIGFGKLGAEGMMPQSDLDLVYLCDTVENHALGSQFASRLNTVINTPMREGRVYELDTRLRPSGKSGSVTISLDSFLQHQLERAHTWSHLALVSARFVSGSTLAGAPFANIKTQVLSRPRDLRQYKYDCAKMLQRVRQQRIKPVESDQFSIKFRPGGLFELEYLIAAMAVLACVKNPSLATCRYEEMVDALAAQEGVALRQALQWMRTLQLEIRLFGRDGVRFEALPAPVLAHVLTRMECDDIPGLIELVELSIATTDRLLDSFFSDVDWSQLEEWKETNVQWLSETR